MSTKSTLHFTVPVKNIPVPVPGVEPDKYPNFDVRGITLQDLSYLIQKHGASMAVLYNKYAKGDIDVEKGVADEAVADLVGQLPELFAALVARASRGVLDESTAIDLPLPVTVDATVAVGELTFAGEKSLEKFMAAATRMLDGFATVVQKANTPQQSGTGT